MQLNLLRHKIPIKSITIPTTNAINNTVIIETVNICLIINFFNILSYSIHL